MPKVTVYSTPTCPWCKKTKEWLTAHKIKYAEVNVAEDEAAVEKMVGATGQTGVPQIEIDGEWIVGFDQEALSKKLLKK